MKASASLKCCLTKIKSLSIIPLPGDTNPAFEKQSGLKNAIGRRMRELAPEHEEYWFKIYGNVALTGEPVRFENRAEQLQRWYDVFAFRIGPAEAYRVAVLFKNITWRKKMKKQ